MATLSPSSRHKSRLIREMSRGFNDRSHYSVASSTGSNHSTVSPDSTMTDFDPDRDEAISSTRQLNEDFSQRLPELRDTAKKYGRWAPRTKQDFVINTSALGKAFEDFTQGSSEDSISVEVARAARTRQDTPTKGPRESSKSPVVTIDEFNINYIPQRPHTKATMLKDALRNKARTETTPDRISATNKENIPPSSQKSNKSSLYISNASRKPSGERRTLTELHAKVADESDGSMIGYERPADMMYPNKSTRFSKAHSQTSEASPSVRKRKSQEEINHTNHQHDETLKEIDRMVQESNIIAARRRSNSGANSTTPNPTQQSFILPKELEITFLEVENMAKEHNVSKERLPVATSNGKVHSRFSATRGDTNARSKFGPVDGIPVPDEEENIYESVDVLKAKVAELEMALSDARRIANEFHRDCREKETENNRLRVEKEILEERSRRTDSALGMNDSDSGNLVIEKTKAEARVASLQSLLDASERKGSKQELRLKTTEAERDAAVKKLTQVQCQEEDIKVEQGRLRRENHDIKHENETLRREWAQIGGRVEEEVRRRLLENEENTRALRQTHESLQNQLSESEENTRTWRESHEAIRNQLAYLIAENKEIARNGKGNGNVSHEDKQSLKKELEILRSENESLKNELSEVAAEADEDAREWKREVESLREKFEQYVAESVKNARKWLDTEVALRKRIGRRDESLKEVKDMTRELYKTQHDVNVVTTRTTETAYTRPNKGKGKQHLDSNQTMASKILDEAQLQLQRLEASAAVFASKRKSRRISNPTKDQRNTGPEADRSSVRISRPAARQAENPIRSISRSQSRHISETSRMQNRGFTGDEHTQNNRAGDSSNEESFEEDTINTTVHRDIGNFARDTNRTDEGSDYASILGPDFMPTLRQHLKTAKAQQHERLAATSAPDQDDTLQTVRSTRSARALSVDGLTGLTGILKNNATKEDLTGRLSTKSARSDARFEDQAMRSDTSHRRRHSENSIYTKNSRRRRNEMDDITSAFIIPDLHLDRQDSGKERPVLSASTRHILDGLCDHKSKNCTVCTRVAAFDAANASKKTVRVPKPVPVSERMPEQAEYEDEPTIRPSIDPGFALATVIKGLSDELSHLKMLHEQLSKQYNSHDASLSVRKRKALRTEIERLVKAIDVKADQIYALFDVVEGQKSSDQLMTEEDVELNLLSLGIVAADDVEEDLPWEGIEETN